VQLRTGRTYEQAIRFLDDMTQGGMNDTNNSIPRIGWPSFEQMMPAAAPATNAGQKLRRGSYVNCLSPIR
jgi:hypothetical protein